MKIAFCQQKSAASRVKDAALLVQVLSGSLFDALGSTARLKLLLETTTGLEAGDRGRLQTAGDLGLGIGVCLLPQIGIWSPAKKHAPFVCIEPWFGRCDREGYDGDLADREYSNSLEAGHSFSKEYVIDIL